MEVNNHYPLPNTEMGEAIKLPVEKIVEVIQNEAVAPKELPPMQEERLVELLHSYSMKASEENKNILKLMLENGIPLTKENILKMNQAMKLAGNSEKALFMLENNMKMTIANAAILDSLSKGEVKITEQIKNIMDAIENLQDKTLATNLKQILEGNVQKPLQNVLIDEQIAFTSTNKQIPLQQNITSNQFINEETAMQQKEIPQKIASQVSPEVNQNAEEITAKTNTTTTASTTTSTNMTTSTVIQLEAANKTGELQQAQIQNEINETKTVETKNQIEESHDQTKTKPEQSRSIPQQTSPNIINQTNLNSNLPQNLIFNIKNSSSQDIEKFVNSLKEIITQVNETLTNAGTEESRNILAETKTLETFLDFTSQLRNQTYIQLPMFIGGQESQAELHVYKDTKKLSNNSGNTASALIALETANLGHFETYVQKNEKSITCQFRLKDEKVVQAVRDNIHRLNDLLKSYNYNLDSFSFLPQSEPYTVLTSPKVFEDIIETPKNTNIPHFDKKA